LNKKILPIVLGGGVNGYSAIRSIYETFNIKSKIIEYRKYFSYYSKFSDYYFVSDPKSNPNEFVEKLIDISKNHYESKKIIFPTTDAFLIPLLKNMNRLEKHYIFPFSKWSVVKKLIFKDKLYQLCKNLNIKYPRTQKISRIDDLDLNIISFPVLVKPSNVVDFETCFSGEKKNKIFDKKERLIKYLKKRFTTKDFKSGFIVQNYIKGGTENLYTITTYTDKNFDIKGASIGHKLNQYPPDAGTIRSGYVNWKEGLFEDTQKLFKETGFYGIANTEYKLDQETGEFYMMEVNPRSGVWNYSCYATGVDLFGMSIKEHALDKEIDFKKSNENIVWTIENKDRLLKQIKDTPYHEQIKNEKNINFIDPRKNPDENFKYKSYLFINRLREILIRSLQDLNPSVIEKIKNVAPEAIT